LSGDGYEEIERDKKRLMEKGEIVEDKDEDLK
jgi:hypothetical protein